jgi:hypothetical protein
MRAVSDLCAISRSEIQSIVDAIPLEWQVNAVSRHALVSFLYDRASYLCQDFVSLLWRQGELDI